MALHAVNILHCGSSVFSWWGSIDYQTQCTALCHISPLARSLTTIDFPRPRLHYVLRTCPFNTKPDLPLCPASFSQTSMSHHVLCIK